MLTEYLSGQIERLSIRDDLPMHRKLYEALRRAILDGKLSAGHRLPSSRELAQDLRLSRNTVVAALNQLNVEGLLTSHVGRGTYVSDRPTQKTARPPSLQVSQDIRLSQRGQKILTSFSASQLEIYPFTSGIVDFSAFPVALWRRLQHKHWRMSYPDMLDYSYSGGHAPLRNAIAGYLRVFRNMSVDTEQVIITTGRRAVRGLARMARSTSRPSTFGSFKSSSTSLGKFRGSRPGWSPLPKSQASAFSVEAVRSK